MALGLSGSNSGISEKTNYFIKNPLLNHPLEISYFVNNSCNLNCKHCYVGYNKKEHELSVEKWKEVFNDLINMGALTFGNVGKEPLLNWDKTKELLEFFYEKRKENPKLRFGIVTNATLMNEQIIKELSEIMPDYIDVSLDGTRKEHDYVRGEGVYNKVTNKLKLINKLSPELSDKIFISSVLMKHNKENFGELINEISKYNIKHFLISPYVATQNKKKEEFVNNLTISNNEVLELYKKIVDGKLFNGQNKELEIILKNDYDTLKSTMDRCVEENIIDLKNLLIDEYGVIFNKYDFGNNQVIINYLPANNLFNEVLRISHDGYVGNCYAQFFENYPEREKVIGNVRNNSIEEILKPFLLNKE